MSRTHLKSRCVVVVSRGLLLRSALRLDESCTRCYLGFINGKKKRNVLRKREAKKKYHVYFQKLLAATASYVTERRRRLMTLHGAAAGSASSLVFFCDQENFQNSKEVFFKLKHVLKVSLIFKRKIHVALNICLLILTKKHY